MKGYIGITSYDWWNFLKNKEFEEINFWNKKQTFKVMEPGDYFFFLKKNEPGENGERKVVGYAEYERFEYLSTEEAWNKYLLGNGHPGIDDFMKSMGTTLSDDSLDHIGCIILKKHKKFETPIFLSDVGVEFANAIVSGKSITEKECNAIINASQVEENTANINIPLVPLRIKIVDGKMKVCCGNCKNEFDKAKRCPECGQLAQYE